MDSFIHMYRWFGVCVLLFQSKLSNLEGSEEEIDFLLRLKMRQQTVTLIGGFTIPSYS